MEEEGSQPVRKMVEVFIETSSEEESSEEEAAGSIFRYVQVGLSSIALVHLA